MVGAGFAGEGLCRFVNVAYARRRHAVKGQQPNVIHGYQIGSDDASDLRQSLINHMTRRSIDAFGVADEFADRAASLWSRPIVDREEDGEMTYASSTRTVVHRKAFEVSK